MLSSSEGLLSLPLFHLINKERGNSGTDAGSGEFSSTRPEKKEHEGGNTTRRSTETKEGRNAFLSRPVGRGRRETMAEEGRAGKKP